MNIGDKKTERFEPAQAYGDHRQELVFTVPKDQMPEGTEIEIGDMLQVGFPDGSNATVTAGPTPGSTPTAVPSAQPTRHHIRFGAVRATEKPCINCAQTSIRGAPLSGLPGEA